MKQKYIQPNIQVVEFKTELGFATSNASSSIDNNNSKINFLWHRNTENGESSINTGAEFGDDIWLN